MFCGHGFGGLANAMHHGNDFFQDKRSVENKHQVAICSKERNALDNAYHVLGLIACFKNSALFIPLNREAIFF
jgi:hypothetical protein